MKVKGGRHNVNDVGASGEAENVRRFIGNRHRNRPRAGTSGRLLQMTDDKDDAGFLSSGFFGSFSDFQGAKEDDDREQSSSGSTTTTSPPSNPIRGSSNDGGYLSNFGSYGSYYGGLGRAFQGGFPIRCR